VLVHERSAEDKPEGMPELRQVDSMLAAGWGGLGRTRSRSRFVDAPDVQYSIAPTMDGTSDPSVWRSSLSLHFSTGDMDDLEMPSFLRKQGDDSEPFELPPVVSRTNPDWWACGVDSDEGDLPFHTSESSPSSRNEGYQGLTPAGLREFLRINAKEDWPESYAGLVDAGLGHEVAEWLEFVVGHELGETLVVSTFLDVVSELTFSEGQDASVAGEHVRPHPAMQEAATAPNTLAQLLAQALVDAQPRCWPERVIHFAEVQVVA